MEARLGFGMVTLVVTVLGLAFFTALSAPLAYGLALLCGLMATGTAYCLTDKRNKTPSGGKP